MDNEITFEPYSKVFLCKKCRFPGQDKYCGNCGTLIQIDISEAKVELYERLLKLDYHKLDDWSSSNAELFQNYFFEEWKNLNQAILIKSHLFQYTYMIDLVVIDDEGIEEKVKNVIHIQNWRLSNQGNIQNSLVRKERMIDKSFILNITYVKIGDFENLIKFKGRYRKVIKTKFRVFNKGAEPFIISYITQWRKTLLNTNSIIYEKKKIYDLVNHQCKIISYQLAGHFPSKKDIFLINVLFILFESITEYFNYLIKFFLYPTLYIKLIKNGTLTYTKIINLYMVGLLLSVLIPLLLSGGNSSIKKMLYFNEWLPFFSDIAEFLLETSSILIITFFIQLFAFWDKKKGSFLKMFFCIIFFKGFTQIFDRIYFYSMNVPFLNLSFKLLPLHGNTEYYSHILQILRLPFLIYTFYIYKMIKQIYNSELAIIGWFLACILLLFINILITL